MSGSDKDRVWKIETSYGNSVGNVHLYQTEESFLRWWKIFHKRQAKKNNRLIIGWVLEDNKWQRVTPT